MWLSNFNKQSSGNQVFPWVPTALFAIFFATFLVPAITPITPTLLLQNIRCYIAYRARCRTNSQGSARISSLQVDCHELLQLCWDLRQYNYVHNNYTIIKAWACWYLFPEPAEELSCNFSSLCTMMFSFGHIWAAFCTIVGRELLTYLRNGGIICVGCRVVASICYYPLLIKSACFKYDKRLKKYLPRHW